MKLPNVTALKQSLIFLKRKEALEAQLREIERKLSALLGEGSRISRLKDVSVKKVKKSRTTSKRRRALAPIILKTLQDAGKNGMTVAELATAIKAPVPNLHVWFSTTGKAHKNIRRIKPGTYSIGTK